MAILSAYATLAQYRSTLADRSTAADALLTAQLAAVSRELERHLWLAPGYFNASETSQVRVFDGSGDGRLWLRDTSGFAYCLSTLVADGLKIDSDLDGSYDDYALDFSDTWVRGLPENAVAHSEPFTAIELRPLSTATLTQFPRLPGCVQITGTWGWAAVPQIITDLVIHRTHDLRQGLSAGMTGSVAAFDVPQEMQPRTLWLFREAEKMYGRALPVML